MPELVFDPIVVVEELPVARFEASPTRLTSGEWVTFDASGSFDPDGWICSFEWDFGDGTLGSGPVAGHRYVTCGTYSVSLTVTDNDGNSGSQMKLVWVSEPAAMGCTYVCFVAPFQFDVPDADDLAKLAEEFVTIRNGSDQVVDLTGWTLSNTRGAVYRFPSGFTLMPGTSARIRSGCGDDTACDLYWCHGSVVWENAGGTAILLSETGDLVDSASYGASSVLESEGVGRHTQSVGR